MDIKRSRRLLKDISNYGWEKFQEAKALISETNSKHIMLVAYMSQCQVNFDGIISLTLPSKPQGTAGVLQLRALQECFINTKLITLRDDETFANYLYINSEYERIKTTKVLLNQSAINQSKHDEIVNEANQIISNMKSQTTLPTIPSLIAAGRDYYDKQQFSLRKKCEIIDYLYSGDWEYEMGSELPIVLLICPSLADLIYAKRRVRFLLDEGPFDEDIHIRFATSEQVRRQGVTAIIWEEA